MAEPVFPVVLLSNLVIWLLEPFGCWTGKLIEEEEEVDICPLLFIFQLFLWDLDICDVITQYLFFKT